MSAFSDDHQPSSSQFIPPQSAQPLRSLFGGPSSDVSLPSSQPESPRRSIFGGASIQNAPLELDLDFVSKELASIDNEDDELDQLLRERPLRTDYDSEGESFHDDEEDHFKQVRHSAEDPRRRKRSRSPIKTLVPPTYVLDRGLDLPAGIERPNRWIDGPSAYHKVIVEEKGVYDSIMNARARDLAAHLYNCYIMRNQANQISDSTRDAQDEDVRENGGEEEGSMFFFRRGWTAWPLPAASVPRPDETVRRRLDGPDTVRMPPDTRPSADLEESIIAVMMKIAKERFMAREWDYDGLKSNRTRKSPDPDAMTDGDNEDKKHEDKSTDMGLRPVIQSDDGIARQQLRPLSRNVISQLDRLLTGLHHSIMGRGRGDDSEVDSGTSSDEDGLRSRSRLRRKSASRSQSRGRRRVRRNSRHTDTSNDRSSIIHARGDLEDESMRDASSSRGRSISSRREFRHQRTQRDWSEVIGLASMMGLPADAVKRASQRCADLFGQDMSFQTLHEGRIDRTRRLSDSTWAYAYVDGGGDSDSDTDSVASKHQKRRPKSKSQSQPQSRAPRSRSRAATTPDTASASNVELIAPEYASVHRPNAVNAVKPIIGGKGPHRKLDIVCPVRTCPRHINGFSRTWNLNQHMKRVHPSYGDRRSQSLPGPEDKVDLTCPVENCFRHVKPFTRVWNLDQHIKTAHPEHHSGQEQLESVAGVDVIEID